MADTLSNNKIIKQLGFDETSQWIFYSASSKDFFQWFAENISADNLLTNEEVLLCNELQQQGNYFTGAELDAKINELESRHSDLLTCTDFSVAALEQEVTDIKEACQAYAELLEDLHVTDRALNAQLCDLDNNLKIMCEEEAQLKSECLRKANELDDLQMENAKLMHEANECFTIVQNPALFMSQMPLEQYVRKCASFMQHFNQYLQQNFKIQSETEAEENEDLSLVNQLEELRTSLEYYMLKAIKQTAFTEGFKAMTEASNVEYAHIKNLTDLSREMRELKQENKHLCAVHDTLIDDLAQHVQEKAQLEVELVLYENTKLKLERAKARNDNCKRLLQIVGDALANADLLWVATELDLERWRNRFDNTPQKKQEYQLAMQRIKLMRTLPDKNLHNWFVSQFADILSEHSDKTVTVELKTCLYEYEKTTRLFKQNLQNLVSDKMCKSYFAQLQHITQTKAALKALVFDSPLNRPLLQPVHILKRSYEAEMDVKRLENELRKLRALYMKNYTERFAHDKFWRYSQLLWVWYLTDHDSLRMAMEEVKKAAAEKQSIKCSKALAGIKRRE